MVKGSAQLSELTFMKSRIPTYSLVIAESCIAVLSAIHTATAQVNVTQFHNHASRDGLYIDSAFTLGAAANLTRDLNFDGTISGVVYAQPLYIEGGPCGRPMVIAVTLSNNVYALDALDGSIIWERNVGPPVSAADLCNPKFGPMGIIGTPIVDLPSRALFFDTMTTPDGGTTKKHLSSLLTWTLARSIPAGRWTWRRQLIQRHDFTAAIQQQRPALGIVGNILYVGYGSMRDGCAFSWLAGRRADRQSSQRNSMGCGRHRLAAQYGESVVSPVMA